MVVQKSDELAFADLLCFNGISTVSELNELRDVIFCPCDRYLRSIPISFYDEKIIEVEVEPQEDVEIDVELVGRSLTQSVIHYHQPCSFNSEMTSFCTQTDPDPEPQETTQHLTFTRSNQLARSRIVLPDPKHPTVFQSVSATLKAPKKRLVKKRRKMAAEVLPQQEPMCFYPSSSTVDRPFKLLVKNQTFLIDSDSMSRMSPIFSIMCFGKDFEKMDLSREIVDEKPRDIDIFLRAVHDTSIINSTNFSLVLRLSNKYQVQTIIEACEQFVMRQHLDVLRADEIMTMLIAAHDYHCKKEVVQKLIKRLATEGNAQFTKLKISRYLPAMIYGAVISTAMSMSQIREHESMNGHYLKMDRSKIRWRQSVCAECKSIAECSSCDECKKSLCKRHVEGLNCSSDYGKKVVADLKKNVTSFEWDD